jgi:hypothetical protein
MDSTRDERSTLRVRKVAFTDEVEVARDRPLLIGYQSWLRDRKYFPV